MVPAEWPAPRQRQEEPTLPRSVLRNDVEKLSCRSCDFSSPEIYFNLDRSYKIFRGRAIQAAWKFFPEVCTLLSTYVYRVSRCDYFMFPFRNSIISGVWSKALATASATFSPASGSTGSPSLRAFSRKPGSEVAAMYALRNA